ncbi:hypothetical protein [Longispora urticae]
MSDSRIFHQLTSYSPERPWYQPIDDPRVTGGFVTSDPALRPAAFKEYDDELPTVELPVALPRPGGSAAAVLSGGSGPARLPDLGHLARLLFRSTGVVRYRDTPEGPVRYRAAGSAGNRHPLEVYVVTAGLPGLPGGVWHHDPLGHRLRRVGPAPGDGPTFLVLTGVPWRSAWRYAERSWRHLWWDSGTVLSHLLALAADAGIPARVRLRFPDQLVGELVGAAPEQEYPLVLLVLGAGEPALRPVRPAVSGRLPAAPAEFPLIGATHKATEEASGGWLASPAEVAPGPPWASWDSLDEVIARRGSARRFDPGATLPASQLRWAMAVATRPVPWDAGPSLLTHHVVAHAVEPVDPGVYRWFGDLLPGTDGDQREAAHRFCLGSDLARDAAYLVVHCADLAATVDRLGERGYRAANVEAGIVKGRLHLAAHTLGHGASGMVFNDELVPAFLRADTTGLLATVAGVPTHKAAPGGTPLDPTRLRPRR